MSLDARGRPDHGTTTPAACNTAIADYKGRSASKACQNPVKLACLPRQGKYGSRLSENIGWRSWKRRHQRLIVLLLTRLPFDVAVRPKELPARSRRKIICLTYHRYQLWGGMHSGNLEQVQPHSGQ